MPKSYKSDPARYFDADERSFRERQNPDKGVSPWDALFHFVNRERALELYEIDPPDLDFEFLVKDAASEEAMQYFIDHSLRRTLVSLKTDLLRKLIFGDLQATGISSGAALDAPPREILAQRWEDLQLDLKSAIAYGPGYTVSQILIFDPERKTVERLLGRKELTEETLRDWYKGRVERLVSEREKSSRDRDYTDADAYFGRKVPRKWMIPLREDFAPAHWSKRGRPRKKASKS